MKIGSIQLDDAEGSRMDLRIESEIIDGDQSWMIADEAGENIGEYAFRSQKEAIAAAPIIWGSFDFQYE